MPKHPNQKMKLLYLYRIFQGHTNAAHGITVRELISELSKYGVSAERKSIYDDIEALKLFGMDIKKKRLGRVKYYAEGVGLNTAEMRIISDLLTAAPILSAEKTSEILKKLCTGNTEPMLSDESTVQTKSVDDSAYKSILLICRAMSEDKKLVFKLFGWNSRKQRIFLDQGKFLSVSPWRLEYTKNGSYKLLAYDGSRGEILSFSPENMTDVSLSLQKREGAKEFEEYAEKEKTELSNTKLRCSNSVAQDVFRKFGLGITVLSNREGYFEVLVKQQLDEAFFAWLFSMGDNVLLLSPEDAVSAYGDRIEKIRRQYHDK